METLRTVWVWIVVVAFILVLKGFVQDAFGADDSCLQQCVLDYQYASGSCDTRFADPENRFYCFQNATTQYNVCIQTCAAGIRQQYPKPLPTLHPPSYWKKKKERRYQRRYR
jgi:hypothetical protein